MDCIHQPEVRTCHSKPSRHHRWPTEPRWQIDEALTHEASRAGQAELRSKNERLKLLLDLNNAIVSNLDLRDLLRAIASSVRQVMKCDSVGVALPDPDDQRLRIHAVDFPEGKGLIREESKVPSADGPTSRAFRKSETIALDAHALAGLDAGDLAVAEGFRALCDIPLVSRNRALGVCAWAGCTTVLSPGTKPSSYARW